MTKEGWPWFPFDKDESSALPSVVHVRRVFASARRRMFIASGCLGSRAPAERNLLGLRHSVHAGAGELMN